MPQTAPDILDLISSLRSAQQEFCVATVVRTENVTAARAGAKAVILADGTIHGFLGGSCVLNAVRTSAAMAQASGEPSLIRIKPKDQVSTLTDIDGALLHKSGCPSGGTVDVFIEPMRQPPRLVVCGGSLVAVAVADLGRRMGYRVTIAAPTVDLPGFDGALSTHPIDQLASLEVMGAYVVIATQGTGDSAALRAVLGRNAAYVGFVSSRRKADTLRARLKEAGLTDNAIAPLIAPAGLNIHAIDPEEIALSILAEIVSLRRAGMRNTEASDARLSA